MFGSEILEAAIGLVFVYLLLSLLCSALNEWIARGLALRSRTLQTGIRCLLADDEVGRKLAEGIYTHPLIDGFARPGWFDRRLRRGEMKGQAKPSYIPSRTFALALFDLVAPDVAAQPGPTALEDVRSAVKGLGEGKVPKALLVLIDDAEGDLHRARENVERWFDHGMERVSGQYKRRVQLVIAALGLLFAVALNVDTLDVGHALARDATLRASVVAAAQEAAAREPVSGGDPAAPSRLIQDLRDQTEALRLPVGWEPAPGDARPDGAWAWVEFVFSTRGLIDFWKIVGLLLTAVAVSLGAPFWFDLLNKLVNLRSSGDPPEEAPRRSGADRPSALRTDPTSVTR